MSTTPQSVVVTPVKFVPLTILEYHEFTANKRFANNDDAYSMMHASPTLVPWRTAYIASQLITQIMDIEDYVAWYKRQHEKHKYVGGTPFERSNHAPEVACAVIMVSKLNGNAMAHIFTAESPDEIMSRIADAPYL